MTDFDGTDRTLDGYEIEERMKELRVSIEGNEGLDEYEDEETELAALEELVTELREIGGEYFSLDDVRMIHPWHADEYVKELVEENSGDLDNVPSWITDHIDWEAVAEEYFQDHDTVSFLGTEYLLD